MITGMNESKAITKHFLHKLYGRKCNLNQKRNKELCQYECRNPIKHY